MTDRMEREKLEAVVDEWAPTLEREDASVHAEASACCLERQDREQDEALDGLLDVGNKVHESQAAPKTPWWRRLMSKKSQ